MPGIDVADYGDSNRAFLQAFLARSVLTLDTAKPILAAIFSIQEGREVLPDDVSIDDLNSYISAANSKLSPLDLDIRSTFHQQTRERWYALVNTTSDSLTQLATTYTAEEIAYVKRLLDAMFEGPNNKGRREAMCIGGIDAVQLHKPGPRRDTPQAGNQGLTMREAEGMLRRLVDEGWLEKSPKGFYSLSPRALMELRAWLVETYNDQADEEVERVERIKFCHACREIITVVSWCVALETRYADHYTGTTMSKP
jgi:non-structural maintenance of chromosomes element 1